MTLAPHGLAALCSVDSAVTVNVHVDGVVSSHITELLILYFGNPDDTIQPCAPRGTLVARSRITPGGSPPRGICPTCVIVTMLPCHASSTELSGMSIRNPSVMSRVVAPS